MIVIAILLLIAGATILVLSSPAEREIYLKGELNSFVLPRAVELDLPLVNSVHLRGIELQFGRVSSLQLRESDLAPLTPFSGTLTIAGSKGPVSASAVLRPVGRRGIFTVSIPKGTTLSAKLATSSQFITLRHAPPEGGRVALSLESDGIDVVEANRVSVRPALPWSAMQEPANRSMIVSNEELMVKMDALCFEECSLEMPSTEFAYLPAGSPMPVGGSEKVLLPDFHASSVILRGVKEPDLNMAHESALELTTGARFAWISISAAGAIRVIGRGTVTSLRQDGREVLPSRAADLMSADPAQRGVYGGAALLLVFAWGVLFNRAVDIIARIVLPE